jgi:DNA repair protein RecN (Recombination protein N)
MLTYLSIENFAIIEKCELEFHANMTVITGETGAGKSIILDAIELILGGRAESQMVRPDTEKCEITAIFDISHYPRIQTFLSEKELGSSSPECFLRRTLSNEGRSRSFINNQPVPLQLLREIGSLLIDLHGQHEQQALLSRETHRKYLDAYAKNEMLLENINECYIKLRNIEQELEQYHARFGDRETRLSFLEYQIEELSKFNLTEEFISNLEKEYKLLSHAKDHIQIYQNILNLLDEMLLPSLSKAENLTQTISHAALNQLFDNARIQLEEASHELNHLLTNTDINPEKLSEMEAQLSKIDDLARKHRVKPEALPELYSKLSEELKTLKEMDSIFEALQNSLKRTKENYFVLAKKLSETRRKNAPKMAKEIETFIHDLGMKDAKFSIDLISYEENHLSAQGLEKVDFLVSANPGQPLQPLSKVASGGELSRISLAIDLIAARNENLPTLIFDEVDVGIGGGTASKVGQLLRQLSENTQVICITHLPQVAAHGKYHLHVEKTSQKNKTLTQINYLNKEEKIQEIARMLGGIEVTKQALLHAKELIKN